MVDAAIESGELQRGWNNWAKGLRNYMQFLFTKKRIDEKLYYEIIDAFAEIKPTGTRDIDLKDEEIKEAYKHFKEEGNKYDLILFKLLVFSGLRLAHVLEALQTWNPDNVRVYGDVAAYDMETFIEGNKKAFIMLFPAKMLKEIERFPESYTYNVARHHINYKRVSAITIRHWHYNFMILDNGIPEGVANFIQGRSPENIGSANYLAKKRGAIQKYQEIVNKFPIPP
ncbi:integrase [Archaeoglobus veneficus]|nr:integrase [Archaeoglobus veneficus]